jgi:hypothetical protein
MTTEPALQKTLKGLLYTEEEGKHYHKNIGKNKSH